MKAEQPDEVRLDTLYQAAEEASRSGRIADAIDAYRQILQLTPDDARALNALGNRLLAAGDAAGASRCLSHAVTVDPEAAALWLNLSFALRAEGQDEAELAALDRALTIDPYFVIALLHKAQWFERHDEMSEAIRVYRALLAAAPDLAGLPLGVRQALEHGRLLVSEADDRIAAAITAELPDNGASERVRHCLDILAGRRKVYVQRPVGLHVPYLPALQFFDRNLFPWLDRLEAATAVIREELLGLLATGDVGLPYVRVASGQPVNQWSALNHSLDWAAQFLWKDGAEVAETAVHFPRTLAILRGLPLLDIPLRGPTIMLSTLRPRTHIPPHHGVTNMRSVVHLPLIVPPGCRFRVGSETRHWKTGEAWVFDDTIEHEAWNDSDETRVILLIDVWNPLLTESEITALRQAARVLGAFGAD